ncbi:twin-arginine translocase TatA/TatE family subunit [Streptomyces sp. NPDC002573]|uniref:twin-arginine translocase TatA/TatE family subunit n=1 Tax=Streptomyces sp. NPDC002573 TaxID=3364651 RepID=UPI0036C4B807
MPRNGLDPWQLLIVAIVIILLFGTKELPGPTRAPGRSMRILKSEAMAMKDGGTARSTTASIQDATPASTEPASRLLRAVPSDDTAAQPTRRGRRTR